MKKLVLINDGVINQGYLFGRALSKYFDVKIVGDASFVKYGWDIDYNWLKEHKVDYEESVFKNADIILGIEHGTLLKINDISNIFPNKIYGCQILDYPIHVFYDNKDYNERACNIWPYYEKCLSKLDLIIYNQKRNIKDFKDLKIKFKNKAIHEFIKFPVKPIFFDEEIKTENIIVYSGRISPDKGIHYVISALGLIEKIYRPKFVTIGNGYDFSSFANYLRVDYENIKNCSEEEKYKYYHKSKAIICGADNVYIPALCILEGISIGKPTICFDSFENREHYKNFCSYANPGSIINLSGIIRSIDDYKINENGIKYCKEECTYEAWSEKVFNMVKEKYNDR